tara:strand:+ start:346 stop:2052 length:1707 start_codon:yes stop_codon:yes gene_type:complete
MANQMKQPPMQKQAERLAAQGRFGDTMLVHMNPAEVEGIASLMPGGQLTTNPQTGQPEAFIGALITAASALAGGLSARKSRKAAQKQTDAIMAQQQPMQQYSADTLRAIKGLSAFKPAPVLADMDPSKVSFLPKGASQGFNLDYQNVPGTMYANYQPENPFAMGALPRQVVQQPVMQEPVDTDQSGGTVVTVPPDDVGGMAPDFDSLELINASRRQQGLPEFESVEDFYDFISDINEGGPGGGLPFMVANEGGLASLPMNMRRGGNVDSRSIFAKVPGLRRMAMTQMKATSPETTDAKMVPQDQDVIQEIPTSQEDIEEQAKKLSQTGMPLSKRLERQMRRADRREARRQRRADRIAARNDPGGYEQVVSRFAPKTPARPTDDSSDTSTDTQQQPRRIFSAIRDAISRARDSQQRAATEREAINAANAYGRSMGVAPRDLIGGMIGGSQSRYEDFTDRLSAGRPILSFFNRLERGFNDGGIAALSGYADGDMVENFPRVNGPISGPGTETSDDIPAMLSDGEFVVNAKAVRGIGRLNGANKSKEEQRREGARMMYALQRAGEQAMRRS